VRSLRDLGEQLNSRLQRADKLLEHLRREQARTGKQKRIGMQVRTVTLSNIILYTIHMMEACWACVYYSGSVDFVDSSA
jgi:hypothetical protein